MFRRIGKPKGQLWLPSFPLLLRDTKYWYPCCGGKCKGCTGDYPNQIQVVIAGHANDNCNTCDVSPGLFNNTFVTDFQLPIDPLFCEWLYEYPVPPCGAVSGEIVVRIFHATGIIECSQAISNPNHEVTWRLDDGKKDCMNFANLNIPFITQGLTPDVCDSSGATFRITTVP